MTVIDDKNAVRATVTIRNPFTVEDLPFLGQLYVFAYRKRRRGLSKRMAKPVRKLFNVLVTLGAKGLGRVCVQTADGPRSVTFDARNTQYSALYMPDYRPVYETETSVLLDRLIGDNDVFFDIGANWGWYSVYIATRPSFRGVIHAFEPLPSTSADLRSFVKQAGLDNRIACHDIAVSVTDGKAHISLPDGIHSGLASLNQSHGTEVRVARLDSLDLPAPNVIKIDVEGSEMDVLLGAEQVIKKARPYLVMESWANSSDPETTLAPLHKLVQYGYDLFYPGWTKENPDQIHYEPGRFYPDSSCKLTLMPFLPAHRFQLGQMMNIIAVSHGRLEEFRKRFEHN
ncbi:MAG: FkbM family methyltransferase [Bdellovibrionales bacterium]